MNITYFRMTHAPWGRVIIAMAAILQGSAVTQTTLSGLTIYPPVANFLQCISAKNYEN